ncbi:MAG: hypothetical protein PUD17_06850 [Treponema sp.]|uniref:hypothetical protein n=1 Tax=Treponema sp. TaxID=166 RepID=UPI00298E4265|nr:hypothetical protein [Treponema sp.]MDD5811803.1 hypothetical protein [Treponema sp.]
MSSVVAKDIKVPQETASLRITYDGKPFEEENLSGADILLFSILFEGEDLSGEEFEVFQEYYNDLLGKVRKGRTENELENAELIMKVMYDNVLSNYSRRQTKLSVMFKTGNYNCVSSSLLFLALAKDCGLDARIQETSVHAFITVYTKDGQKFDVETTNPAGVNPGEKKMISQNSSGSKKYTIVPKTYYSNRVEISDRKAVTLPAKNICAELSDKNEFEKGIPLAASVYEFVTKEKAAVRKDYDAICANFAAYANQNRQYEAALKLLRAVMGHYGKSDLLVRNYNDIAYNAVAESCNINDFKNARNLLVSYNYYLTEKTTQEIIDMIFESEKLEEIQDLMHQNKFLEAAKLADEALLRQSQNQQFKKAKSNSLYNHGVTVHNQVVPLLNNKEYKEALQILENALKDNPSNQMINDDIKKIKSRM